MTAHVTLNGKGVGLLWCVPYHVDVSDAIRSGENTLTVDVTSTWHNRLAYDAGLQENERKTWTISGPKKDAALAQSGLVGPVILRIGETIPR